MNHEGHKVSQRFHRKRFPSYTSLSFVVIWVAFSKPTHYQILLEPGLERMSQTALPSPGAIDPRK
jgi:hypothetical protein